MLRSDSFNFSQPHPQDCSNLNKNDNFPSHKRKDISRPELSASDKRFTSEILHFNTVNTADATYQKRGKKTLDTSEIQICA